MYDIKDSKAFDTDEEDFDTVMASDITFTGNIRFAKPFMIKGKMSGNIDEFGENVWNSLNFDNKVSLFVRYVDLETGKWETRIINKNK